LTKHRILNGTKLEDKKQSLFDHAKNKTVPTLCHGTTAICFVVYRSLFCEIPFVNAFLLFKRGWILNFYRL
jgi:hypothetical protein